MVRKRIISQTHLPEGLFYLPDFLTCAEEESILKEIESLPFAPYVMGSFIAKRTVVQYGAQDYRVNYGGNESLQSMPNWLAELRQKCGSLIGDNGQLFEQILVARYENASIGWHRDAPQFGPAVIGLSLHSANIMRFRRMLPDAEEIFRMDLAPRSLYIMSGKSRSEWQHSMPESKGLRFSITFRTISGKAKSSTATPERNQDPEKDLKKGAGFDPGSGWEFGARPLFANCKYCSTARAIGTGESDNFRSIEKSA